MDFSLFLQLFQNIIDEIFVKVQPFIKLLSDRLLEQINIENVYLLCKDLPANPCHEIVAGGLCPPLSDNLKVNML
jgi:hypothetical protein